MEIIRAINGEENFKVTEEPSETQAGAFWMHLVPNCGVDVVGCSVEVDFWYLDLESLELRFEVNNDTVEGLSND